MRRLLIAVLFHDGRYHGLPDWPPSPARLFQALVAGVARGESLEEEDRRALAWLESLEPPEIAAARMRAGRGFTSFVPNNDLDALGGDPSRVSEIRAPKLIRPIFFDAEVPLFYVWPFTESAEALASAERIGTIARQLYQLGRGVDMAWGWGEILAAEEAEARLLAHPGSLHRPGGGRGDATLAVPATGSLESLLHRYDGMRRRFQTLRLSKPTRKDPSRKVAAGQIFVQPPRARFRQVAYDSPAQRLLFDVDDGAERLDRIVALTERLRDGAARRLKEISGPMAARIDDIIVGRPDGEEGDKAIRIRIIPLPSIGHAQVDRSIRRVLVEIPPNCPLPSGDLEWAFSGLSLDAGRSDASPRLVPAAERGMLWHYGVEGDKPARVWRTVTPAALPQRAARRRIDPARRRAEAKAGTEQAEEERKAVFAAAQALRHAGISVRPLAISVQREPFEAKEARAEAFARGTRFAKERLWHVEVEFAEAMSGPLVLGDGRYLGLGLMRPVRNTGRNVAAYSLAEDARISVADRPALLRAMRRALMALSRDEKGRVPQLFSGHEADGAPAGSGHHSHVFLAAADLDGDGRVDRLIVAAPWACDRSAPSSPKERTRFDAVTASLETVRAGRLGVMFPQLSDAPDPKLSGPARVWESHVDYRPTRYAGRGKDPAVALLRDLAAECERRGLPRPEIELLKLSVGPKDGVTARLRLRFAVAVAGPILLGRDSHQGGGLFEAV